MKKLLVIAMFAALAASSFAAEFTLGGNIEYWGVFHNYSPEDSDSDDESQDFNHALVELNGKLAIVEGTNFFFRSRFQDAFNDASGSTLKTAPADRFWLEHQLLRDLKVSIGRMGQSHSTGAFARDWFDQSVALWGSSTRDIMKAEYALSDTVTLFLISDKWAEGMNDKGTPAAFDPKDPSTPIAAKDPKYSPTDDRIVYVAGAKVKVGEMTIDPSVSYLHGKDDTAFGAKVNFAMKPATGVQVEATGAMYKQQNEDAMKGEKPMLFGAMVDVAYAAEFGKVGFFAAYGSSDEDSGTAFSFGDDWNRTKIIDDGLWATDPGVPPTGATQLAIYADLNFGKITVSPIFAYYILTDQSAWNGFPKTDNSKTPPVVTGISEDASMMEFDLTAKYKLTNELTLGAGVAYAMISDLNGENTDSGWDQMTAYWNVMAKF